MKSFDDGAGDDQFEEKRQEMLDDAAEKVIEAYDPNSQRHDVPFYQTTDFQQFETSKEALKHQYKIERGAL